MGYDFSGRYKHTDDTSERGGRKGSTIFAFEKEVKFFVPKEGTSKIDILPYKIKSKKHPLVVAKTYSVGDFDYVYDVFVHKYIGGKGDDLLCPKKNFDKPCPICEAAQEAYQEGDKEKYASLKAKRRCFYNVITHNEGEEDEVKVFDTSFEWFEKELCDEASSEDHEERVDFASPDTGKRIKFRSVPSDLKSPNGKIPLKYKSFTFIDRDSIEDRMDEAISFDEFAIIKTYDELKAALYGEDDDEEEDDKPPKEEKPSKEDKSSKEEKPKKDSNLCPHGHAFGKDCDKHKECGSCKSWSACDRAS